MERYYMYSNKKATYYSVTRYGIVKAVVSHWITNKKNDLRLWKTIEQI